MAGLKSRNRGRKHDQIAKFSKLTKFTEDRSSRGDAEARRGGRFRTGDCNALQRTEDWEGLKQGIGSHGGTEDTEGGKGTGLISRKRKGKVVDGIKSIAGLFCDCLPRRSGQNGVMMKPTDRKLSSDKLNWNAGIGSVCGISLSTEMPAINLHSYKFWFARAIRFEVRQGGVKLVPAGMELTWYPHKMEAEAAYPDFTLKLQTCFVDAEIVAVEYAVAATADVEVEVTVSGGARNGTSLDTFFQFRGRVERHGAHAFIDQEIDIPDYCSKPMGPFRTYTHHLLWLIEAPEEITVSQDIVETEHPERTNLNELVYAMGTNRSNSWLIKKSLAVKASAKAVGQFFIGTRWLGTAAAALQDRNELRERIGAYKNRPLPTIEGELVERWDDLLAKIPSLKEKYREHAGYRDLYAKAWVCILQNISDSLVTARKTIKGPTVLVGKVCSTGFGPAQWETSLAGFLISFIDAELGVRIIESVINSLEIDGFIPEDLVFNRDVKLSSYEPLMLEIIYRRTGRIEFLERNYDNAFKQLVFHIKHTGFYYLEPPRAWSLLHNYSSLLAMGRIAVVLGKSSEEIRQLRDYTADVKAMLTSLLAGKELDAHAYDAICDFWDEGQTREALAFIKQHLITPDGLHFLYGSPDGKRDKTPVPDSFKMSGYLLFILALEKLNEGELLDQVVAKTFAGLVANGDFWECYYVNGDPWGNGPMSIFGAFGWIWSVMEKKLPLGPRLSQP